MLLNDIVTNEITLEASIDYLEPFRDHMFIVYSPRETNIWYTD